jgi:uncharacterized membrane protein HdeD (DUF308 family)
MAIPLSLSPTATGARLRTAPQRIAVARALLAFVWAAALVLAVGDKVPTTDSDVPTGAALLLASYPLIDVIASLVGSAFADRDLLRANAAVSAAAVVAIGATAFGSDAGSTLLAFGGWAVVSGAIQLAVAVRRRRAQGRQLPMIISGGLSTIAGISFLAASGNEDAHLATLAGYMALGGLLFLLWATRDESTPAAAR